MPIKPFVAIGESIVNLISHSRRLGSKMENIYVPHFNSCPTEPFVQKEQQTKHAVAKIGDLDKSTGSIRVR